MPGHPSGKKPDPQYNLPTALKKTFGVKTAAYNWEIPTNCFKGNL